MGASMGTNSYQLLRSAANSKVILVGAIITWVIIFNMVTSQLPGKGRFSEGMTVTGSDRPHPRDTELSDAKIPEGQTVTFQNGVSLPGLGTAKTLKDTIPTAVTPGSPRSVAAQQQVIPGAMLGEKTTRTRPRNLVSPVGGPAADRRIVLQPPADTAEMRRAAAASNPTAQSHNPLSCFTDHSTPEQRQFSENEKAMFRYLFDWPEVPTSSCKRMFKMGGLASGEGCLLDGDKHVCLDEPLSLAAARDDCLIYSFGINYDWSFDEAAEAFGCEVHSFDPSIDYPEGKRSPGITFHHFGIGRNNHTNIYGWQLYTLDEIVNLLGHQGRTIHYLKMDAEGGEFNMMAQQLLDDEGDFVLDKVEQIGFEVHFRLDPHLEMGFYRRANRSVHAMRELGFNMVHWEYNKVVKERYTFPGVKRPVSLLYEVLLIKNGPDTWKRSERGRRHRQAMAMLAAEARKFSKSLMAAVVGT